MRSVPSGPCDLRRERRLAVPSPRVYCAAGGGERVSLRRTLGVIALVYVVEGWPMGVFRDVWPVYFRDHGVSLQTIGYLSGLYIAWSLKVLWSPLVDRFGERRSWITGALLVMAAALAAMAWRAPQPGALLWLVLAVFCAASATQDVAIDAYTTRPRARGA